MRIAIISDIHGNCLALDAVLTDLQNNPTDQIVCLGDAIQGGPQPAQTVARLRALNCPVVMGNADAWLLTGRTLNPGEEVTQRQLEVREWSLSQLSAEDLSFIESFQPTVKIPLHEGRNLLCFHGSPSSFDDVILPETPEEDFQKLLGDYQPSIMTGGHTHIQFIRRLGDTFFFNPGSVGLSYNAHQPDEDFHFDPWAAYAVLSLDRERLSLDFRRVPYDIDELRRIIISSGMPHAESRASQYRPIKHA